MLTIVYLASANSWQWASVSPKSRGFFGVMSPKSRDFCGHGAGSWDTEAVADKFYHCIWSSYTFKTYQAHWTLSSISSSVFIITLYVVPPFLPS